MKTHNKKNTLLRVIPTMTCWVEVVRWGLSLRIWWEKMENLRTLISGFLGLVILVRWALVTTFLSWTTQTGCRIHRTYVSLIGSGEGRHTTHLLQCVLLLSTSQTDWKQSSDVLSDISFDILSDISSDISSDILSDISSDILSDIFLTYLLTFFLTNLLTLFLTYLLTFFLTYLSTCFLTYLLTFFLTYQNQNLTSTASHKKPLCKLYIYLTPRSKSNIHDNFVPVNVIALSASDRPAKRQLSPKMQNAVVPHTHTHHMHQTAPPKGSWVQKCKRVWSATTTSHGVCKPRSQMLATAVLPPVLHRWPCSARYLSPTHALHPPQNEAEVRKTAARFSSSCSPSAFGTGLPSYATYHLFPSTTSSMINIKSPACVVLGGSMHTYMRSAPTKVNL